MQKEVTRMIRIRQKFDDTCIDDVGAAVRRQFKRPEIRSCVHAGDRVAVGCGSRGIHAMAEIAKATVDCLLDLGAKPFIFHAMGSHGGATALGQCEILASYGITEETMGVPIDASMETVPLGETESGIPIFSPNRPLRPTGCCRLTVSSCTQIFRALLKAASSR